MTKPSVAVLFARRDSVYKTLPDCDVWDADRDATLWPGGAPIVAHPPCRSWGTLAHMAQPREGERELAPWAIKQIRQWGGVLEHPRASRLWPELGLPEPGRCDKYGGWTLEVLQWWWGHRAAKATRLYICGYQPSIVPAIPAREGEVECVLSSTWAKSGKPGMSQNNRERTPPDFAKWLVAVAKRCGNNARPSVMDL
jgi:hypothetical protein